MDSSNCFYREVKHLFRHLHEPGALRRNPLVSGFFKSRPERIALGHIHGLIRKGAEACRGADRAAGNDERARRRHLIITQHCLERRPIQDVADGLGISYRQCYRERSEVCRDVARFILEYDDTPALEYVPELDEFQLKLDRLIRRASSSEMRDAFRECEQFVQNSPLPVQKIEALRASGSIAIDFGDIEAAERSYRAARSLYQGRFGRAPSAEEAIARGCIELLASDLSYYRADTAQALRRARSAMRSLEATRQDAPARCRSLYVESAYKIGAGHYNLGELDKAYDFLALAEARLGDVRPVSTRLRSRVMVGVWRLRNQLVMSSKSWFPSSERLRGLADAFDQAYASGFFFEAIAALLALTEQHACARNDDAARHAAHSAVLLASQQHSKRVETQASIQAATMLMLTRYWHEAPALLSSPNPDSCDGYHRALVSSFFSAECALRVGAFERAWALASDQSERLEYPALTIRRRLIAAAAAHELERRREAYAVIEATIPTVERLDSAPILRDTYSVAAKVTGDRNFQTRAREVARLLTA
jgi:hypothetical protein